MSTIAAVGGKVLWRIEVTQERMAVLYVLADTHAEALADAEELASQDEWDEINDDLTVRPATRPPENGRLVWTGGPDGDEVPWSTVSGGEDDGR